ncbi:MAG: ribonuclease III [Thiotrichales bacterium]|jgi:ribonuclease-3|nr:ribonuclease III [Thiotrichales bacterium]MBT3855192.1 ribonuclease III [Thiotrichales bacterium]MBT5499472.1 ribonuclease III [Thiotrichales bacterium]MBT6771376.1 ribonuclease III [Thiotrichales bacterium]MBT7439359.1 ribonuclease III [Thiotrichales bacterium]
MEKLQKNFSYEFNDIGLLKQALTHRSVSKNNNERLEFLGDSVLGCVISEELYIRYPLIDEGQLSRLRSHLVRGQTLANLAKTLNISESLTLGQGELKSGGFRRESILADAFEAILGAIFLDSDYLIVKRIILELFDELLNQAKPEDSLKDFKTQLQELLQKKGYSLPSYELIQTKGKDHNAIFYVSCTVTELNLKSEKNAKSIKRAEQACAQTILEEILN